MALDGPFEAIARMMPMGLSRVREGEREFTALFVVVIYHVVLLLARSFIPMFVYLPAHPR